MRNQGTILIPAAGESRRFADAGYRGHKGALLLEIGGVVKPMLQHIIDEMPVNQDILIVCQNEHVDQLSLAVRGCMQPAITIMAVPPTRGQSETMLLGLEALEPHRPVIMQNCDTLVRSDVLQWILGLSMAQVLVHHDKRPKSAAPIYSYVNNPHWPTAWGEKVRISDYAQTGLWSFPTVAGVSEALAAQLGTTVAGEAYLSGALPAYRGRIAGRIVTPSGFLDLGTPEMVTASGARICS